MTTRVSPFTVLPSARCSRPRLFMTPTQPCSRSSSRMRTSIRPPAGGDEGAGAQGGCESNPRTSSSRSALISSRCALLSSVGRENIVAGFRGLSSTSFGLLEVSPGASVVAIVTASCCRKASTRPAVESGEGAMASPGSKGCRYAKMISHGRKRRSTVLESRRGPRKGRQENMATDKSKRYSES